MTSTQGKASQLVTATKIINSGEDRRLFWLVSKSCAACNLDPQPNTATVLASGHQWTPAVAHSHPWTA